MCSQGAGDVFYGHVRELLFFLEGDAHSLGDALLLRCLHDGRGLCQRLDFDERYDTELPALRPPVDTCEQGVAWRDFRVELQVVNA